MHRDFAACYRALSARDSRFDGRFFTAVRTTGVYCRPICPARTPLAKNVQFFPLAATAEAAGFRPCRRCRPEASPGSADWNARHDLVGRALRLIERGDLDGGSVAQIARQLAVSERQLRRLFTQELGAGPLSVARTRRGQLAKMLIDRTQLPFTRIANHAGYASIRQFNAEITVRFGAPPRELRRSSGNVTATDRTLELQLTYRRPYAIAPLLGFFRSRAIPGVEEVDEQRYRRSLVLDGKPLVLEVEFPPRASHALLRLDRFDIGSLAAIVQRTREVFDLDADPLAIAIALRDDGHFAPLIDATPGLRVPGAFDGFEMAVRAILGQQVTVAAARTLAARIVSRIGVPLAAPVGTITHAFPPAAVVAESDLSGLGITTRRASAIRTLAGTIADGTLRLDSSAGLEETRERLESLPGIGGWTASYIALRVLRDPSAFLETDLGIRTAAQRLGIDPSPKSLRELGAHRRPWSAYALMYLWSILK